MKYILIFVLFNLGPNKLPTIGHQVFSSSKECELAKEWFIRKSQNEIQSQAICVSELELMNYTRR